ncbi:hypothetical protein ACRAWC_21715 [Leifsonia sp. L25]|jgi:hypothetical protein|uniref:DUF2269 domain-containing protein n=2 Tax=Bacillati TaxID=1783272 RepID=A0A7G6YBT8_9MICO|nr:MULTISPECIES: hypothetical protein [Leifsonia]MBN9629190.1 hypothetical protein [Actinomycetota bacterium]NUU07196.1 hypothetical protein [Leifsonia sp. C5G2]QNE35953.1 hypothetical protein F1C12_12995 [Leifsonia shinshuensis]
MTSPRARTAIVAWHVGLSIGWVGAVAAFATIATLGWTTAEEDLWAGIYAALRATIWFVIVPLAGASLISGIFVSLITRWGLTRHYWVLLKLILTVVATAALALHAHVSDIAAHAAVTTGRDFAAARVQLVVDSVAGLIVLCAIALLSFIKPRGITPWAARERVLQRS